MYLENNEKNTSSAIGDNFIYPTNFLLIRPKKLDPVD